MCTAITYKTKDFYFGRTLDYEHSFGEKVVITPRNFSFDFRSRGVLHRHHAIIGMARIEDGYPLYFDAANEKGLAMAGLNFVDNAYYPMPAIGRDNIPHYAFIPWILTQCSSVSEAKCLLRRLSITGDAFSSQLPPAKLHWILADTDEAITIESVKDGLRIYENVVGVLTNNPPFDQQPRHGRLGSSRRSFLYFPICPCGIYQTECRVRCRRRRKRQPVFSDSSHCFPNQRLLPVGKRALRNHPVHFLLQCHPGHLLLYHLQQSPDHRCGYAKRRSCRQRTDFLSPAASARYFLPKRLLIALMFRIS